MIIDTLRIALLVENDWFRRYLVDFLFSKKKLVFKSRGQKLSTSIEYNQPIRNLNHKLEEYKVNMTEWEYNSKGVKRVWNPVG